MAIKNIFAEGPGFGVRLLLVSLIGVGLFVIDQRTSLLEPVRAFAGDLLQPVYWLVQVPQRTLDAGSEMTLSREALQAENAALKTRLQVLEGKTQRLAAVTAEVNQLRALMNVTEILEHSVLVARVTGVNPNPYLHEVLIDKGAEVGAFVGQAVLDSEGLVGQITRVDNDRARVLLVSDSSHAVPVQVLRNGVRGIVLGSGRLDSLFMVNMPDTADVVVGDQLHTSGLGQRFPAGYPVGEVVSVSHDPGEDFARIEVRPRSELTRTRDLLLVFPVRREAEPLGDLATSAEASELQREQTDGPS